MNDLKKNKSSVAINKLRKINPDIKLHSFNKRLTKKNINQIAKNFDLIVDGSDNFRTRFLINDYCLKNKKILVSGAISKFDGQVYTFNFSKKKSPCLRCFIPKMPSNPDVDNCEYEGVLGSLAGIIGTIQANEVVKEILEIGDTLCGYILIIDALKLTFRKVKLNKRSDCYCNEKKK
jgi:adenylyltransferase/sulfurtransferase